MGKHSSDWDAELLLRHRLLYTLGANWIKNSSILHQLCLVNRKMDLFKAPMLFINPFLRIRLVLSQGCALLLSLVLITSSLALFCSQNTPPLLFWVFAGKIDRNRRDKLCLLGMKKNHWFVSNSGKMEPNCLVTLPQNRSRAFKMGEWFYSRCTVGNFFQYNTIQLNFICTVLLTFDIVTKKQTN